MNKKIKVAILTAVLFIGINLLGTNVYATTGKTINDSTRIRKTASTKAEIVEVVDKGQTVEVVSEEGEWYKISFKIGKKTIEGYIRKDLLEVEKTAEKEPEQKQEEQNTETSSSENKEETQTEASQPEEQQSEPQVLVTEKAEVELANDADIKVIPLVFASKNGTISKGNKVTVSEIIGNWCHIESASQDGWIIKSKLEGLVNKEASTEKKTEEPKQEEKKEEKQEETKKEETKKEETKKEQAKETTMYVSTTTLNVREKADTGSKVIDQLDQNDKVTVTEKVDSTWSKVKVNGKTGYVATKYLSTKKTEVTSRSSSEVRTAEKENKSTNTTSNTTATNTTTPKNTETKTETKTEAKKEETKTETKKETENKTTTETKKEETSKKSSGTTGADIVAYAKKYLGYKYVYGTAGPNTFDCSGFTSYVYKHFGYTLNRTSGGQRSNGTSVSKSDLKAGDIVCFSGHVGIYIGGNQFIHAANAKKGVIISSLSESYYAKSYITARRIIN